MPVLRISVIVCESSSAENFWAVDGLLWNRGAGVSSVEDFIGL